MLLPFGVARAERPAAGWRKPDFDDSKWKQGPGGFGTRNTPGTIVRTTWNTRDIWIRRTLDLADTKFTDLHLRMHHDEDAQVYINGVLAAKTRQYTVDYQEFGIRPAAKAALRTGRNVVAVHCHQTRGGQYIDVGLVNLIPVKRKPR